MEKIIKEQELLMEKCPVCGQEITGHSEAQVNARMNMHKTKHKTL